MEGTIKVTRRARRNKQLLGDLKEKTGYWKLKKEALDLTLRLTRFGRGFRLVIIDYINPYPTAFPYGNGMVLHFYQQQESSTTKTVHKVINKGLKAYV